MSSSVSSALLIIPINNKKEKLKLYKCSKHPLIRTPKGAKRNLTKEKLTMLTVEVFKLGQSFFKLFFSYIF